MHKKSRSTLLRGLAAAIGFTTALTAGAAIAADPLKVGFVYVGPDAENHPRYHLTPQLKIYVDYLETVHRSRRSTATTAEKSNVSESAVACCNAVAA